MSKKKPTPKVSVPPIGKVPVKVAVKPKPATLAKNDALQKLQDVTHSVEDLAAHRLLRDAMIEQNRS